MPLSAYALEQREEWDSIVQGFSSYDVYYLNGYVRAFHLHGDGEPVLLHYHSKECQGINVLMKRDISLDAKFRGKVRSGTLFDAVTPYGYGGWLVDGDGRELFAAYGAWCKENHVVSEFVRYHPVLGNHRQSASFYDVVPLGACVAMDLGSKETIWANLTSQNRNKIRKAKKSGIKIFNGRYPKIFDIFREMYHATMDKKNADGYYYFEKNFYQSIMEDLPQNSQVFYAELGGKAVAASIVLAANGRLNYHLSASLREYQNLAPTNLLLYEAALWGWANGCKTFQLGGGVGSQCDSLYEFKKAFYRREPQQFYVGRKVHMEEEYQELVRLRGDLEGESGFFPKYRA